MSLSDANLGIILGGAIALVPTVLSGVFHFLQSRSLRRHELALRRIDLVEPRRLDALQQYMDLLGRCLDQHKINGAVTLSNEVPEFLKAHERALLYVGDETAAAMIRALPDILAVDPSGTSASLRLVQRHQLPRLSRLDRPCPDLEPGLGLYVR